MIHPLYLGSLGKAQCSLYPYSHAESWRRFIVFPSLSSLSCSYFNEWVRTHLPMNLLCKACSNSTLVGLRGYPKLTCISWVGASLSRNTVCIMIASSRHTMSQTDIGLGFPPPPFKMPFSTEMPLSMHKGASVSLHMIDKITLVCSSICPHLPKFQ